MTLPPWKNVSVLYRILGVRRNIQILSGQKVSGMKRDESTSVFEGTPALIGLFLLVKRIGLMSRSYEPEELSTDVGSMLVLILECKTLQITSGQQVMRYSH